MAEFVKDVMTPGVVAVRPDASIGLPVGLVSLGDLAEAQDPGSALADISRAEPDESGTARSEPPKADEGM